MANTKTTTKEKTEKEAPKWVECSVCGGTGVLERGEEDAIRICENCRGTGKVLK